MKLDYIKSMSDKFGMELFNNDIVRCKAEIAGIEIRFQYDCDNAGPYGFSIENSSIERLLWILEKHNKENPDEDK